MLSLSVIDLKNQSLTLNSGKLSCNYILPWTVKVEVLLEELELLSSEEHEYTESDSKNVITITYVKYFIFLLLLFKSKFRFVHHTLATIIRNSTCYSCFQVPSRC